METLTSKATYNICFCPKFEEKHENTGIPRILTINTELVYASTDFFH
jgi:hypothetical protein